MQFLFAKFVKNSYLIYSKFFERNCSLCIAIMSSSLFEDVSGADNSRYSGGGDCLVGVNLPLLISGILIILLALIDMIVLFVIPTNITNNNKKKLPNANFESPNKAIIAFHFLEHIFLLALGIILVLMAFCDFSTNVMIWTPVTAGILFFICYIVLVVLGSKTRSYNSQMTIEEMSKKLTAAKPIEYIFIYIEGQEVDENCRTDSDGHYRCNNNYRTCYSKRGVRFPVESNLTSAPFDFTNVPSMFYFRINQELSMSGTAMGCLNDLKNNVQSCNKGFGHWQNIHTVEENFPLPEGSYIISTQKIPNPLKKPSRICCILFGVTAFYEIYSKSVPIIDYQMDINVGLSTPDCVRINVDCNNIGTCRSYNKKPTP